MRDLANKMAELKFEAPLAQFEETDEWGPIDYQSSTNPNANQTHLKELSLNLKENDNILILGDLINNHNTANHNNDEDLNESFGIGSGITKNDSPNCNTNAKNAIILAANGFGGKGDTTEINFTETFSASLEDLVNTFDDKITKCFGNYEESVEELAPVQVRTQEEIMNECQPNILSSESLSSDLNREFHAINQQMINKDDDFSVQSLKALQYVKVIEFSQIQPRMWWTITGNFGNILPIDWSKSHSRQMHMPTLNLGRRPVQTPDDDINDLSSEDEAVANDLDMHTLILGGLHTENEPIKTAEEVIKEIDDIMDETTPDDDIIVSEVLEKAKEVLGSPLYEDKLRALTIGQLNELYMEMEVLIREFSETLISELALRDEFEYEKELKNTFISLLLAVQNRRRQYHVEKKRGKQKGGSKQPSGLDPKYLTTVIPYSLDSGPPDNQTLQILIKILKAINEDNPTVPTLLTDYILKVLCPT